jgi:NADH dehydrogenase
MKKREIVILGGTGFVGRYLINRLSQDDVTIRVPTRRRERNRHLRVNPKVELIETDIHDDAKLESLLSGADVVINLVGILHGSQEAFRKAHAELPERIVKRCNQLGITRLLHMSALQAGSANAMSQYLRTKGEGENSAHHLSSHKLHVTSFRPSVIFGEGDSFFNQFAKLLRLPLVAIPLACPEARFAPVYAADVAEVMAQSIDNPTTFEKRYDICGPKEYSLMELVEITERAIGVRRLIVGMSDSLSKLQAKILGMLPGKLMTTDNYLSMQLTSTCKEPLSALFQIEPTPLEGVIPHYLGSKHQQVRYMDYRTLAKR